MRILFNAWHQLGLDYLICKDVETIKTVFEKKMCILSREQVLMKQTTVYVLAAFAITAIYDIVLQLFINGIIPDILGLRNTDWLKSLVPYFEKHTPLAAALIAGFIGAVTQMLILKITNPSDIVNFLATTFVVSGLVGFPMKFSGMFPVLNKTYYKTLGPQRAFFTDAYSGIIVNATIKLFLNMIPIVALA